jgi:hypothetical protein
MVGSTRRGEPTSSRPEVRPALERPVSREGPPIEWARSRDHRRRLKVGRDVTGELGQSSSVPSPEPVAAGWARRKEKLVWHRRNRLGGFSSACGVLTTGLLGSGQPCRRRLQNRRGGFPGRLCRSLRLPAGAASKTVMEAFPGACWLEPISTPATPGRAKGIRRNAAARPAQLFIAPPSAPPPTRYRLSGK